MMADISALGDLNSAEPLDLDIYKDASEGIPLPKKGRYVVQAPDSFPNEAFSRTKAGFLSAQVDPTILGPTNEGYTLRFTKVSAKTFKRGGITASHLGDYLRATGRRGQVGNDPQAQAEAVEETANQPYQVEVDWRAYNKSSGYQLEGMERFPSDGNGGHLPWCEDPNEKDPETGKPVRLRANVFVKRFVPAGN